MNLEINKQLKSLNIGVAIRQKGRRLYLRATLPAKPGSDRPPHQQEISLGVYANADGLDFAKQEAFKIGAAIATKSFSWDTYLRLQPQFPISVKKWVERFENDYFNRRQRTPKSETTWDKDYRLTFAKLPQDEPLTIENCLRLIGKTQPNSRARQRYVMALGSLCRFAGYEANFNGLSKYSPKELKPRDLPDDRLIIKCRDLIKDPTWQWVYGVLATYGLRPHEVFLIDIEGVIKMNPNVWVTDGKTGSRTVYPFPAEWWEKWELYYVQMPSLTGKNNSAYGAKILKQFKKYKIPFNPYDLRHKWAIRTLEMGLDVTLAAKQMGHSRQIHDKIYHRWIDQSIHEEAFNRIHEHDDPTSIAKKN
ncbi:MAG: hypothetical protein RID09_07055 [Coleofasciculus sp. G1-WW12-02]|uniref:site-specific integrase n=1 Tax=Coleofasciculus sp. G1-WW12-02 TaxID=3068483 RepID=UPI003303FBD1